ncbi:RsmB/NOP family class I SAM-dependent RNA methyltransferase [Novosphingobium sp. TH158]|uniref:RsmB/NOP family class I SAM-dependent RNA methyltransferase n=1 Tax=Novosphingobium sp. TH158 TaxID=2067455 RepID=UPI000C7D1086|nr:RsmB/NOP family class I SAM-dependent RNA methyltransferase [Novosphingobium sp. TH158]PLK26256.1 RNA methyltransferase [Novosphingobium sp. TH158]
MAPAARVQAAIEILDLVIAAARSNGAPADRIVGDWFRTRRFAGSKDRRAVRELVYAAIRACGEVPQTGRAAMLRLAQGDPAIAALFDGSSHAPAPVEPGEPVAAGGAAPKWLVSEFTASGLDEGEIAALLDRAPLDVRINTLKAGRLSLPEAGEPSLAPNGLRFPSGTPIDQWEAFQTGAIEVQDAGSQLACEAVQARPGERIVDLCAGAGGKSLSLAAAMDNLGEILACDADRRRLSQLAPRAERAGASIITTQLLDPGRELASLDSWQRRADAVLVDAPCSGTGTWRRNPEARWRLTARELDRLMALQARLLAAGAKLVRPGGRLVYVTCSLLDGEGAAQVGAFLAEHPGWRAQLPALPAGRPRGPGLRLTPAHDGTDGFFIASLFSPC